MQIHKACAGGDAAALHHQIEGGKGADQGGNHGQNTAVAVDDQNPCTYDSCDPVAGVRHDVAPAGTSCGGVDVCLGGDACNDTGECRPAAEVIDDGNVCTEDTCIPMVGIMHVPLAAGAACVDDTVCNGDEFCDGGGVCLAGTPPVVDDGNACTVESCDPVAGVSQYTLAPGASCSDGNACNGVESCTEAAICQGVPPVVDDGNPCTLDSCDPVTGVQHVAAAVGEERDTIEDVYEPFLVREGYLARTPRGRVALPPAYAHLGRDRPRSKQPGLF